jgi:hypothetical protein
MLMHPTNADLEAGIPPSPELIAGVGQMIGEMARAGVFVDGAGLRPSALGVRLTFSGGQRTVTRGPLSGRNELTAALCILQVRSLDEAVDWASRFAALVGDAEIDIRPVTEPWDIGIVPQPAVLPTTKYMAVLKADKRFESGEKPAPRIVAAMRKLAAEAQAAGVYVTAEVLQPSRHARRLSVAGPQPVLTDGPFTETKELIAGFALLRLGSLDEALEWAPRYARVLGCSLDLRPLHEPEDFT